MRLHVHLPAVLLLASAGAVVGPPAGSVALVVHRTLNDTRAVGTAPVHVPFPLEHFGVVADVPGGPLPERGRAPYGEVRFLVHGRWSGWRALAQDGAQAAGHFTSALVAVDRASAYQVRALPALGRHWRAAVLNTSDGPAAVVGHRRSGLATAATACRSRADWGADESITGWSKGTDVQSYYPVQALTVHHTAGSNDATQDYAATVRAIYSYHVTTNGWSDIGYSYLVDGHGVVYEGRNAGHTSVSCLYAGGDGSDFAHQSGTDDLVTGAHVTGFNAGNAGIALMGCYDASSACSGDTTPPAAAVDALEWELTALSSRHHLDPQGTVAYSNPVSGATATVPTISGHRDWAATACPGGALYAQLPAIRAAVAARLAPAPAPSAAPAQITSASCSGGTCSFSGTGTPTLSWAFGNGATASGSSVSTRYTASGSYTVTLRDGTGSTATRGVSCSTSKRKLRCVT